MIVFHILLADGRWQMADGRWQMADGRWQMADGRWQMADVLCHFLINLLNIFTIVIWKHDISGSHFCQYLFSQTDWRKASIPILPD